MTRAIDGTTPSQWHGGSLAPAGAGIVGSQQLVAPGSQLVAKQFAVYNPSDAPLVQQVDLRSTTFSSIFASSMCLRRAASRRESGPRLDAIVLRGLARNRSDRFASASAMANELEHMSHASISEVARAIARLGLACIRQRSSRRPRRPSRTPTSRSRRSLSASSRATDSRVTRTAGADNTSLNGDGGGRRRQWQPRRNARHRAHQARRCRLLGGATEQPRRIRRRTAEGAWKSHSRSRCSKGPRQPARICSLRRSSGRIIAAGVLRASTAARRSSLGYLFTIRHA